MKRTALLILAALLPAAAMAQDLTAEKVLDNMTSTVDAATDASMVLYGEINTTDGGRYRIEIEAEVIPDAGLARLFILQPDALADNFIVLAPEHIYSYNYMTNQLVIYSPDDPAAFGGLIGETEEGTSFTLTLDLEQLFDGWIPELGDTEDGAVTVTFTNADPEASIATAVTTVDLSSWLPRAITVFGANGSQLLELELQDVQLDPGLDPEDLQWYPSDAEVIDERR